MWLVVLRGRSRRRVDLELLAERERSEAHFRSLVQNSSDVIVTMGRDGIVRYVSPSIVHVLGITPESYVGRDGFDFVHRDDLPAARELFARVLAEPGRALLIELRVRDAAGEWRWVESHASVTSGDLGPEAILNFRDITERRQLHDQLRFEAGHDSLTRLANRATFRRRIAGALERHHRDRGRMALLYLDLDDFKQINDTHGHAEGDRLLATVGERLAASVRGRDLAARLGGDEFGIVVEDATPELARRLAERLLETASGPWRGGEHAGGASVGIALSCPGDSPEDLLQRADAAMYRAKADGKGRYRLAIDAVGECPGAAGEPEPAPAAAADLDAVALRQCGTVDAPVGRARRAG
jgi:diguanylate cyclase (GGDEF)-like protein/PAS domain S-box-containing protein